MNLIELHILQSFPVTCLNRDDVGSPKSATFGGVNRARLSSQCLKRATRLAARETAPAGTFSGIRSRFLSEPFKDAFVAVGQTEEQAAEMAKAVCETFSKIDGKDPNQVTTAVYLSPSEIEQIAKAVAGGEDPKKAAKNVQRLDAADIALFGRMVANDATLNVEGAAMFSHALSTHETGNEIDFFSAVDDRKADAEDAGAGMIGTLEFNSATYYRYAAVNLDLLADKDHLAPLAVDERRKVLRAFLTATLEAVPSARRNSMNGATLPEVVLGVRKSKGQPLQLVNAFEDPAKANGSGLLSASKSKMEAHLDRLKKVWGIENDVEAWLDETTPLPAFLDQLLADDV
jgi:CRISPR system Cascade subunit CasC